MPTAGKFVGAVTFAVLALWSSWLALPLFPDGRDPSWFYEVNGIAGLWVGWAFVGARAGRGYSAATGIGLTGSAMVLVMAMFFHASEEMLERALDRRYDGASEALVSIFEIGIEMTTWLATPLTGVALFCGGIVAAFLTEFVGQRLP